MLDVTGLPDWVENLNAMSLAVKQEMFRAGLFLAVGLLGAALLARLTNYLRLREFPRALIIAARVAYFLVLLAGVMTSLHQMGLPYRFLVRGLLLVVLIGSALYMMLRPFMPTLPFRIGDVVLAAQIYGKVESISFLYTRLRTFDGKVVFVPNSKIIKETLVNYHTTPYRRVDLDVTIRYEDDLDRARQVMVEIMKADERVLEKPAPTVFVLKLGDYGVHLGGRCWVPNLKHWKARCDMLELVKRRFDQEPAVSAALPRQEMVLLPDGGEARPGGAAGREG
ncbi:MAG: mechanosensitive ion channel family protein [Desulfarculus sp.]|nr:mechanosensitive ion channel family protein [Desulfarculus sp.]